MWDIENKPADWIATWATRTREFSRQEIARMSHAMVKASSLSNPSRERDALKLLLNTEEEAIRRIAKRLGYPDDIAKEVLKQHLEQTTRLNAHVFGIYPSTIEDIVKGGKVRIGDLAKVRDPLLETQL